jgi:predicted Zn-dependent protease
VCFDRLELSVLGHPHSSSLSKAARRRLVLGAAALFLSLATAGAAQSLQQAADLVAEARKDIATGDGIAAEVRLQQAMDKGAAREAVAAYMGQALIAQGELDRAHDWLAPGRFTRRTAALGFRTLARLEQMQGDLPAAGAAFDRVIALTPRDPTLWVDIARLRYAGGEHMLALDAANYAFQLDPANVRTLELRGQIVRDQRGLVASLPWFEAALARAPGDISVLGEYAATLGDLGRAREMLAVTRKMLARDPGNPRAFYLQAVMAARAGNFALARGLMRRVGERLGERPAVLLFEGITELEAGNYVLAAEAFEELVRRQPDNRKARLLLVRALYLSGEYRQLVIRFAADAASPDAPPYLLTVLARSYEALGDRGLAAPLLDRAALAGARAGPDTIPAPSASSEADAEQARADNPGNFRTQAHAGDVQLALGRGEAALERYRLAARIRRPEDLVLRMAEAFRQIGRDDRAAALLETYLAGNPQSEAVARLVARRAANDGDWKRARLLLENLKANGAERDVRVLADLSLAQLRSGDAAAAEANAREAYRIQRASPLAAQLWGLSLAALGQQRQAAIALLAKARRLVGDTALIAEARRRLAGGGTG